VEKTDKEISPHFICAKRVLPTGREISVVNICCDYVMRGNYRDKYTADNYQRHNYKTDNSHFISAKAEKHAAPVAEFRFFFHFAYIGNCTG
jgi:hypothetical protein